MRTSAAAVVSNKQLQYLKLRVKLCVFVSLLNSVFAQKLLWEAKVA